MVSLRSAVEAEPLRGLSLIAFLYTGLKYTHSSPKNPYPSKREVYKAEFESHRKRNTESWGNFGNELLQLVDKAFPTLQQEVKKRLALFRYLDQLAPVEVSFGVKQRRPATVNEAVSSTIELESYLSKAPSKSNSVVSHVTPEEDPVVGNVPPVQEGLLRTMQKLVERVEKLETTMSPQRQGFNPQPPRRGRGTPWNHGGPIVCRRCHQPGHYARGCAANVNQAPRFERSAGNWTYGGPSNAPDMQDVNINNISSYFVLGCVCECPVSFLVDTGAGVSLLRGDVWEKAVPNSSAYALQGACRLIGVDGVPIKVCGAASVNVTVEGHTLSHQFIVADHITAEAILEVQISP